MLMSIPCNPIENPVLLKLSGVSNGDSLGCRSTVGTDNLNSLYNIHAFENLSKDNMTSIKPRCLDSGDEELRSSKTK